ncbi:hypothetical protein E1292_06580 [Nonomuraea deserti]|uniref:Uncharacterized protein n=1 Tax=Nonomuraea deserti TaxID=1848322 RepID=A0A4R4WCA7_9ACTN|nr:hypothetical protein [Nonomuraea deserti]TDD11030.1 hypothetical protein E1292_06580 [Nonomuraea deserti]
MADDNDPRDEPVPAGAPQPEGAPSPPGNDPRDEPAPFGAVVLLTAGSAVAVMVISALMSDPPGMRFHLGGPIALVVFEVVTNEVWWQRWWGAIPGAIGGLACYFEGRAALADLVGDTWGHPIAYVAAWTLFAVVFALCSRYPRTVSRWRGSTPT